MNWVDGQLESDSVARILIHVEGETEETFVNEVLMPHLCSRGYSQVSARLMGNARQRDRRGGIRAWSTIKEDIVTHLKEDPHCLVGSMVDYYALPQTGEKAWPGREEAGKLPFHKKAATIQTALLAEVTAEMDRNFDPRRFLPYVMMHEFEALLFSDCERFAQGIGRPELAPRFQQIRDAFETPEEINDSPISAPSKRVQGLVPGYQKPLMGTLAVLEIGLDAIRGECPHFRSWLELLERSAQPPRPVG
jgi:hypothetical protein